MISYDISELPNVMLFRGNAKLKTLCMLKGQSHQILGYILASGN
jgi:hypothetical protein